MRALVRFAWFVLGLNVSVILLGALVRATGSGAGCGSSWPTCEGELVPEMAGATAVEFTHRAMSGIALVLVAVLAWLVFRKTERGATARTGALIAVVAIIGEALIGALIVISEWVADDASVARVVAVPLHLVNTLLLLAALALTIFWLKGGGAISRATDRLVTRYVLIGGAALILIAATGAVTALADTLFPKGGIGDGGDNAHFLTRLRIVHPVLAVVATSIAWWLSSRNGHAGRGAARTLSLLVGAMLLTGVLNVFLGVPVWMQLTHLLMADLLWITYVFVAANALQVSEATASRLSPSR